MEEELTQPLAFNEILAWLDPDREVAATIYLQLRHDLAKIFQWNRCIDPEGLVDEVMDRVEKKVATLKTSYEGDQRLYFYGVARYLMKEVSKKPKNQVTLDEIDPPASAPEESTDETAERQEECLERCLKELTAKQREFILAYYAYESGNRTAGRKELAKGLGIPAETMRVRAHRVRNALEGCIMRCLQLHDGEK